jgi:hypothetical protein
MWTADRRNNFEVVSRQGSENLLLCDYCDYETVTTGRLPSTVTFLYGGKTSAVLP